MTKTIAARFVAALLIAIGGMALAAATKPTPKSAASTARDWNATVAITPQGGYQRGNPDAPVKLVEFISYTCPHCAHFEAESDATLQLGFIRSGKGSTEVRPFFLNVIDVSATLLASCGPPSKFYGNHTAILRSQSKWLRQPSQSEAQRWSNPDFATRMRAIAGDLGLYKIMETRGYQRTVLDRCLANKALAEKFAKQNAADSKQYNIGGTPSFLVNGELQQNVHSWDTLRPTLEGLTR